MLVEGTTRPSLWSGTAVHQGLFKIICTGFQMSQRQSAVILAAAILGIVTSASAGTFGAFDFSNAPDASTTVAAISDRVTYAKPGELLKTFVAFNVGSGDYLIKNVSGNTINDVKITFTARVTDLNEKLQVFDAGTYLTALQGLGCNIPTTLANPLVISCQVRQLKAGDTFPPFTVFYTAPPKLTGGDGVGDAADSDLVSLDLKVVYAEGGNGGNPTPNSIIEIPMLPASAVKLGTDNPLSARSPVPKSGSTLFTGVGAVATLNDPWTTTVIVPPGFVAPTGTYTTAAIQESITTFVITGSECTSIASNLTNCSASSLTIPGSFPAKLTIYLRRDASTLAYPNKPNEIYSAKIFYSNPSHDAGVGYPLEVPACTDTSYGPLPQLGIPCINKRTRYTKSNSPTSEWLNDWEFEIFARDNGRYIN